MTDTEIINLFFERSEQAIDELAKKHGNAVKRNRIKRLLRASAREAFKDLNKNYRIVIMPKVRDDYSFEKFLSEMNYLKKKENL